MTNGARGVHTSRVYAVLASYVSRINAQTILRGALERAGRDEHALDRMGLDGAVLAHLRRGVAIFVEGEARRVECIAQLAALAANGGHAEGNAPAAETTVVIANENSIVDARTRARAIAIELGFRSTEQYKIATAVSELSRNIFRYAGRGELRFGPLEEPRPGMFVVARDAGPGIANLEAVLSPSYRSKTGLGRGLQGCKNIMDEFSVDTAPGRGTTVRLCKWLWL
jgi:serine/threonine-protein kinase RsbT